jgi:PTS system mannose-specific IIB component
VVTAWVKHLDINKIVIVDDDAYKDDFLKGVLKMVAPSGINLEILSREKAEQSIKEFPEKSRTMVLVKTPQTAEFLHDKGLEFKELNVGGIGSRPDRKVLYRNISINQDEFEVLKNFAEKGIKVYCQAVPSDKPVDITELNFYKKNTGR